MGGGKGLSNQVTEGEQTAATNLASLGQAQAGNSSALFNLAFPALGTATSFFSNLASGDPGSIARAIAPAAQQVNQQTAGARQNIMNNAPAGGEKNLALEQADVNQGAQVGNLASQGYLNSFNNLAQLGSQGIGQSSYLAGTGIYGQTAGAGILSNLGNQQIEQKGASLGSLGNLLGTGAYLGADALTGGASGAAGKGAGGLSGGGGGGGINPGALLAMIGNGGGPVATSNYGGVY